MIIAHKGTGTNDGVLFECVSNSSLFGVGEITGQHGAVLTPNGNWTVRRNPSNQSGVVHVTGDLFTEEQGIYTCIIPDDNGNNITINVGIYSNGFNSKQCMLC